MHIQAIHAHQLGRTSNQPDYYFAQSIQGRDHFYVMLNLGDGTLGFLMTPQSAPLCFERREDAHQFCTSCNKAEKARMRCIQTNGKQ